MQKRSLRLAVLTAVGLTAVAAALVAAAVVTSSSSSVPASRGGIASEERLNHQVFRGGESPSRFEQEAFARAYPAKEIPLAGTLAAKETWNKIVRQSGRRPNVTGTPGVWELYGAKQKAFWPGPLQPTGGPYVASGRTIAMAISPTCGGQCTLLIGAAGGGVWRTENPTDPVPTWNYVSGNFDSNAIGTIRFDPNAAPLVVYAGTGEPNASGDSEAGTGIFRSLDGGKTWSKLPGTQAGGPACGNPDLTACVPGQSAFLGRSITEIAVQPGNSSHILATTARGVRGVASTGGAVSLNNGYPPIGLWESTDGGQTFSYVWNANLSLRGGLDLEFDPWNGTDVYVSAFQQGIWRRSPSLDGNSNFNQIMAPVVPSSNVDRPMFDLVPLANGKTRVYVATGAGAIPPASFWRTDNANQPSATLLGTQSGGSTAPAANGIPYPAVYNGWQKLTSADPASPYWATNGFCTGQCFYDIDVHSPPGRPDDVYVIGSYSYAEVPCITRGWICGTGISNGRAVLYSNTAGDPDPANLRRTFTDFTLDAQNTTNSGCEHPSSTCIWAPHSIHPDQHEIVVNPNNPSQIFESSDGGVIRTNGKYFNLSRSCALRAGLTADEMTACQRVTSRVPVELQPINQGLSTLQFQSVSFNPLNPCDIQGGTQDNGTWEAKNCNEDEFTEIIDGDGGQSGFDHGNTANRFNQFFGGFGAVNFTNGDSTERHWYFSTGPILNSNDAAVLFYWPQIADPVVGGTMYTGFRHVWRTFDWAGGLAFLSDPAKGCMTVIAQGTEANCGDWIPMGGPDGSNNGGDLGGSFYGGDRVGGAVSQTQRTRADTGTLWAATSLGRLFVTHNARCGTATDASCVVWTRVDSLAANDPGRFITGIYPDQSNPNRAWVSYNGYNVTTAGQPGHVFEVNVAPNGSSATFTNLNVEAGLTAFPAPPGSGGDLPVTDVVRDDLNGDLYASTDFGVLRSAGGAAGAWSIAGSGLPRVEVSSLTIVPGRDNCFANCGRAIFAATHGRSIWVMRLP